MDRIFLILLVLGASFGALGDETLLHLRHAQQQGEEKPRLLEYSDFILFEKQPRNDRAALRAGPGAVFAEKHGVTFSIFDAWVEISGDLDQDGYFHHIGISFDADVDADVSETVYAKIYLSRDGGPWYLFSATDLFEIHADDARDVYHVYSELVDGFPPGYYSVLIELHSFYHPGAVSERQVDFDDLGQVISLEDTGYDEPYYETHEHYGGSLNIAGIALLGLLLGIKMLRRPARMLAAGPEAEGEVNTLLS